MSKNKPDIEELRSTAAKIAQRAANDPEFLELLKNDPEQTLVDAGLHESVIGEFIRQSGLTPEVSGYILEELDSVCDLTGIDLVAYH